MSYNYQTIEKNMIKNESGFCFYYVLPNKYSKNDNSKLKLFENGNELSTNNELQQIISIGKGKYKYYNNTIYFSSSDNTDPILNDKKYNFDPGDKIKINLTTIFGSCRLGTFKNILNCTSINSSTTYTHCTKEIIQLIKWIKKEIIIPDNINKFIFRTGILRNNNIILTDEIIDSFQKSDLFIIEICSMKKYIYNNFYLHHLAVDKRFHDRYIKEKSSMWKEIKTNHKILKQTKEEIENDIDEIIKLIDNRKLIIVTHLLANSKTVNLGSRKILINILIEICKKKKIDIVTPTDIFRIKPQNVVLGQDLGHYTPLGKKISQDYYKKKLIGFGYL